MGLTRLPRLCLDSSADFLSTRPEFRDEYPSEQADQDAEALWGRCCKEILEANTRQR